MKWNVNLCSWQPLNKSSSCYHHVITMLSPCYHHVITMWEALQCDWSYSKSEDNDERWWNMVLCLRLRDKRKAGIFFWVAAKCSMILLRYGIYLCWRRVRSTIRKIQTVSASTSSRSPSATKWQRNKDLLGICQRWSDDESWVPAHHI
jgi:hypothetical protein